MDTRIKCIIVDDELPGLHYLQMLCMETPMLEIAGIYNDPLKALEDKDQKDFQICFVDIEMPGMNGIDLAKAIGKPVIFTTAYKEYAADAFDIDAIDYLVKPINSERFRQSIDKAVVYLKHMRSEQNSSSILNTDRGKAVIDFAQVAMINTSAIDARDKQLVYHNGKEQLLKNYTFNALRERTPATTILQVNKQQMVSLRAVQAFTNNEVVVEVNKEMIHIPLSTTFKEEFMMAMKAL
ncbi:Transcriptional regulatory protein YpdB [compost metagenome]